MGKNSQDETKAILLHAFDDDVTVEMMKQIHEVTGGNFRGVDMIIPRILELKQRNRQRLEEGAVKMQDIVKTAASRIMI